MVAVDQYLKHIYDAQLTRAKWDIDEFIKAIRLYNIKEDKPFMIATFTPLCLGNFVGTYLEREPPLDPWKTPYRHNPNFGVVYSLGPNRCEDFTGISSGTGDDIVEWYLPREFHIIKAEYTDDNRNNHIDYGDSVELTFSRPAKIGEVDVYDFVTQNPPAAFGNAKVITTPTGKSIRIVFMPPTLPKMIIGKTGIVVKSGIENITDFSDPPMQLKTLDEVVVQMKRL